MVGAFFADVKAVMAVLALIPLAAALFTFTLHTMAHPEDSERNAELAGKAITEAVHHDLPWWADPGGLIILAVVATGIVGLAYAWKNQ